MFHRFGKLRPIRWSLSQQLEYLPLGFLNPLGLRTFQSLCICLELHIGFEILEQDQKLQQDIPAKIEYVPDVCESNIKPSKVGVTELKLKQVLVSEIFSKILISCGWGAAAHTRTSTCKRKFIQGVNFF